MLSGRFLIITILVFASAVISWRTDQVWAQSEVSMQSGTSAPVLSSQKEKNSYAAGVDVARNFKHLGIDIDADVFLTALRDVFSDRDLLMNESDLRTAMQAYRFELQQRMEMKRKQTAADNKKAGDAFLAGNEKKEGVVTLPSGLQYKVLKTGNGRKPTEGDVVECNYRGFRIDGTEFDSSYRTGNAALFRLADVISGWREALKLMTAGSKWEVYLPSELAYGGKGAGREIGPNEALFFEIELVAIKQ